MDTDKRKNLRTKLAVIKTLVKNVAIMGPSLADNSTRKEYRTIYEEIEQLLDEPNLSAYAPPVSWGTVMSDSGSAEPRLWYEHQAEIVNSGTRLITYIEAILDAEVSHRAETLQPEMLPATIFISHGRSSDILNLLRDFITALGLIPVITMEQPSQGMSVDRKVLSYMKACKCAIILATGDDKIEKSSCLQPRQNVIHEIGIAQQIFPNKIIYLIEESTEFPSNIAPKVYERFTKDNLTKAFIAIVRELRAFGLL